MSNFMKPEVYFCKEVVVVETSNEGTVFLDNTHVGYTGPGTEEASLEPFLQSLAYIESVDITSGWLARLRSAPGYMDRTDFTLHKSEKEAISHLDETYGLEE